jgi:aromatic-L-amino-acid decarboxylase
MIFLSAYLQGAAMKATEFKKYGHQLIEWIGEYLDNIEEYPVKSPASPRDILAQLPEGAPETGEPFEAIFSDFERVIIPGITHWQHPSFFAYFPANSSRISVLAEILTAALGAQCMSWQTSPAATELEERVMDWLKQMLGLPAGFRGVIQDTASTATLCSLLTAREAATEFKSNAGGLREMPVFTAYSSSEGHSSIEKAVRIAGLGTHNLRKIPVDGTYAMIPNALEREISKDISKGYRPLWTAVTTGTTGSNAIDPLRAIGRICAKYRVWLHVDAAYAGTALVLPEMRWMIDGIEFVDSFVVNPHKWMFTNFDCSAYFVKDPSLLVRTFQILPEYLKTKEGDRVNNYRDWSIQLGRRFRALKLWFVIRHYGVDGLREKIRTHIAMAGTLAKKIEESADFELLAPVPLNLICFRYSPPGMEDPGRLDRINMQLLQRLNESGMLYLTHTRLRNDVFTIRMVIGQTEVEQRHVDAAWNLIRETAKSLDGERIT